MGVSAHKRAVQSIVCGLLIGFICGFVGAGGGMMMLLILTSVLGYELKNCSRNERIYHDVHRADRCSLALRHRRHAGSACGCFA